jgi:signal transduction histidine kinase
MILKAHRAAGASYGFTAAQNAAAPPEGDWVMGQSLMIVEPLQLHSRTAATPKSRHPMQTVSAMRCERMPNIECRAARDEQRERELMRANDFYAAALAMAAHDLRQYLQVITSSHELLAQKLLARPERRHLERGQRATRELTEKLDLLTDALRVQHQIGGAQKGPVRLQPVFERLARELAEPAREKRIDFRFQPTRVTIVSCAVMLDGIVHNLARNALDHTPSGGSVLVGCRRRGAEIRIEVHDNGGGIAQDQLAHVFEPFVRLNTARGKGLGLGLFIVKRAADYLGHRVEVRSAPGRGCCFALAAQAVDGSAPAVDGSSV